MKYKRKASTKADLLKMVRMLWKRIGQRDEVLRRIAEIIEDVERRCRAADGAADGPVSKTEGEIRADELREIYQLARRSR